MRYAREITDDMQTEGGWSSWSSSTRVVIVVLVALQVGVIVAAFMSGNVASAGIALSGVGVLIASLAVRWALRRN